MREIKLTHGQVAIIDDWNFKEISRYKWYAKWNSYTESFYAARASKMSFGKQHTIRMHATVAKTPKGFHTDHINHNTLDNRESNLRICTPSQNQYNREKQKNNTSGFKGVFKDRKNWRVLIRADGKLCSFGTYHTTEEAAHAYDAAAKRLHGEFARLNFPED